MAKPPVGTGRPSPPRLFAPDDLKLRRSGEARLIDLARLPSYRPPTERARREEEDRQTMGLLRSRGAILAARFGLHYAALEPEADGVVEHYGICYRDGLIRIRLRHATTGKILKESSLVDTLCHELAHLRVFDHSLRFRRVYLQILEEAKERGWYRPGPEAKGPIQGSLFDGTGCGTAAGRRRIAGSTTRLRAVAKRAKKSRSRG